jgi:hypothetical protein
MQRIPFILPDARNGPLRGDVYLPERARGAPVVVACHGFKGFKDWGFWPPTGEAFVERGLALEHLRRDTPRVFYVGFGDSVDKLKMVPIPAGGVYVAPAGVAHYIWAEDGDATYQESGVGPTAIRCRASPSRTT